MEATVQPAACGGRPGERACLDMMTGPSWQWSPTRQTCLAPMTSAVRLSTSVACVLSSSSTCGARRPVKARNAPAAPAARGAHVHSWPFKCESASVEASAVQVLPRPPCDSDTASGTGCSARPPAPRAGPRLAEAEVRQARVARARAGRAHDVRGLRARAAPLGARPAAAPERGWGHARLRPSPLALAQATGGPRVLPVLGVNSADHLVRTSSCLQQYAQGQGHCAALRPAAPRQAAHASRAPAAARARWRGRARGSGARRRRPARRPPRAAASAWPARRRPPRRPGAPARAPPALSAPSTPADPAVSSRLRSRCRRPARARVLAHTARMRGAGAWRRADGELGEHGAGLQPVYRVGAGAPARAA